MIWKGNLRKMRTESGSVVKYFWSGRDVLDDMPELFANDWIGNHKNQVRRKSALCGDRKGNG